MKQEWKYIKLSDVCHITSGYTPKSNELLSNGDIPYFKVADMNTIGNEVYLDNTQQYKNAPCKTFAKGSVVFPKNGAAIATNKKRVLKYDSIVDLNTGVATFSNKVNNLFGYYWFKNIDFKSFTRGGALPTLDVKTLKDSTFPLPSLEEQTYIVSELDKINELIRLKKEQLQDYDNLAQSIFYEMFGDPVINEKGWEFMKIGEIGTVERGAGISKKDFVEDGLPCIHYGQLHTILGPTTRHHHSCIPESLLPKYKIAHTNDVIMAITSEDVKGSCKSTAWLGNYDIVIGSDAAILHHEQDGTFLSYYTMTKAFFNEKSKYAKGFKVTHISAKEIENIPVYLPPLALQKDFAKRIEVIEQQKENIKSTIQDLETLLASRMQYWFD